MEITFFFFLSIRFSSFCLRFSLATIGSAPFGYFCSQYFIEFSSSAELIDNSSVTSFCDFFYLRRLTLILESVWITTGQTSSLFFSHTPLFRVRNYIHCFCITLLQELQRRLSLL